MLVREVLHLYINGHDHNYERTRSIHGTTYLICGARAGVRPVARSEWTEYSDSKLSFAAYEVKGREQLFIVRIPLMPNTLPQPEDEQPLSAALDLENRYISRLQDLSR